MKLQWRSVIVILALITRQSVQREGSCSPGSRSAREDCGQRTAHSVYESDPLIDCHPDPAPNRDTCQNRGCVWHDQVPLPGPPKCSFPQGHGYRLDGEPELTETGATFNLRRINTPTLFGSDVQSVVLKVEYQSDYRLRLQFLDPNSPRYEVPLPTHSPPEGASQKSRLYDITWDNDPQFGIAVIRRETGEAVFDSRLPGFVFSDQFLQLSTRLASDNVYGFGEHNHETLRHNMSWTRWVMFSKDIAVQHDQNLYGVQPFYTNVERDGNTNGVFFKNSNAMEVSLQPDPQPLITYRTIGGILDLYIFLGPSPEDVVKQFTEAVGRPVMPPYWALGFMLSRWGYNSSDVLREVIDRNRRAGIPLDVQFGDIDYMFEELDFTYDRDTFKGLPDIVQDLHVHGQKFIAIVGFSSCWVLAKKMLIEESKQSDDVPEDSDPEQARREDGGSSVRKRLSRSAHGLQQGRAGVDRPDRRSSSAVPRSNTKTCSVTTVEQSRRTKSRSPDTYSRGKPGRPSQHTQYGTQIHTPSDSAWAFKVTKPPLNSRMITAQVGGKSPNGQKTRALQKRYSEPILRPKQDIHHYVKPRAKSLGHVFEGSLASSDERSNQPSSREIKTGYTPRENPDDVSKGLRSNSLDKVLTKAHRERLASAEKAHPRRYSDPGAMTYVEEREATLQSLRATSFKAKETILRRVSIANCLTFRDLRNRSKIFSQKDVSLISQSKKSSSQSKGSSDSEKPSCLVEKTTETFPLHMMMTTEDAIYGLAHALEIARRNQQLLDTEREKCVHSKVPDPRFKRLEQALLRINRG